MNRYLSAFILAMLSGLGIHAQQMLKAPRLVVNITIDQLRTDYMEQEDLRNFSQKEKYINKPLIRSLL